MTDKAVFIRGMALPDENGPAKMSVKDIVSIDNARVDLPRLISIRVAVGRKNGAADNQAQALTSLFHRKPRRGRGPAAA